MSVFIEPRLTKTLSECVAANPQRFTDNLMPFQDVPNLYQSALLQGFLTAWREEKPFDSAALLKFIYQTLLSERFWVEDHESGFNYRKWVISTTADLISEGTKDDKHAFDIQLFPLIEDILLILVDKTQPSVRTLDNLRNDILNSDRSNVFSAMVYYALRFARTAQSEYTNCRWPAAIRADFTKRLDRSVEPSLEFSYILGSYLPYLSFLDKDWVHLNINRIFPLYDEEHWQAAFSGYLLRARMHKAVYPLVKNHKHYQKALHTHFADAEVPNELVNHICTIWIEDTEALEDEHSLIYQLIHSSNSNFLSGTVYFFSRHTNALPEREKAKVIPAWRALFEVLSENRNVETHQEVLGALLGWLRLIDKIDAEVLGWVKESMKHIRKVPGYSLTLSQFIEALLKHAPKTPGKVGKLYLEIPQSIMRDLESEEESIKETVQILYDCGHKDVAKQICGQFTEVGSNFLRPLYETFRD